MCRQLKAWPTVRLPQHEHVGFFDVPGQAETQDHPFNSLSWRSVPRKGKTWKQDRQHSHISLNLEEFSVWGRRKQFSQSTLPCDQNTALRYSILRLSRSRHVLKGKYGIVKKYIQTSIPQNVCGTSKRKAWQTDRQNNGQSDPYVVLWLTGATKSQKNFETWMRGLASPSVLWHYSFLTYYQSMKWKLSGVTLTKLSSKTHLVQFVAYWDSHLSRIWVLYQIIFFYVYFQSYMCGT